VPNEIVSVSSVVFRKIWNADEVGYDAGVIEYTVPETGTATTSRRSAAIQNAAEY
jgi:hypothetical protein